MFTKIVYIIRTETVKTLQAASATVADGHHTTRSKQVSSFARSLVGIFDSGQLCVCVCRTGKVAVVAYRDAFETGFTFLCTEVPFCSVI